VQATFDLSYRSLPPDAARCYRAVGLHPGTRPGAAVIAAALDVAPERATESLDALVEASLLDDVCDDRYQMHDLVRLHARQRASDDPEHPVLAARIAEWYLAGARGASAVLTPYRRGTHGAGGHVFTDREAALDWLERERANLVAVVVTTADTAPERSWRTAHAMWPLFHLRRHYADRMVVERVALRCARQLGNLDYEARTLRRLGFAHFDTGQTGEAARHFEDSLRLCRHLSNRHGEAAALGGLGVVAMAQQRFADAIGHLTENLAICEALGQRRMAALALFRLGKVSNRSGQPERAVDYLGRAGAMFAELDAYNRARVRVELGRALARVGRYEDGARELDGALADMGRLDSPSGTAQVYHALGDLSLAAGEPAHARARFAEALRVFEQLGDAEADEVRRRLASVPPAGTDPEPA
jgi:tetratricopeptide (TPR) repeat protein